jgi:hypothetical protein
MGLRERMSRYWVFAVDPDFADNRDLGPRYRLVVNPNAPAPSSVDPHPEFPEGSWPGETGLDAIKRAQGYTNLDPTLWAACRVKDLETWPDVSLPPYAKENNG